MFPALEKGQKRYLFYPNKIQDSYAIFLDHVLPEKPYHVLLILPNNNNCLKPC